MQSTQFSQGISSALKTGMRGEIISDCVLNYGNVIPNYDPRQVNVESICNGCFLEYLEDEAARSRIDYFSDQSFKECDISDAIIDYLNNRRLQFNSRRAFREYAPWRFAISKRVEFGEKIHIIIPIFCNIGNPLKRFHETSLTSAEKVTLKFLNNIAAQSKNLYKPGLCFDVVVDANFYSTPFMNSVVETNAYYKELNNYVQSNDMFDSIRIIDMMDVLSERSALFMKNYNKWLFNFNSRTPNSYSETWINSMIHCINIRHISDDYGFIISSYSEKESERRSDIINNANKSLSIYMALKNAAADVNWEDIIGGDFIRATIHTKEIPVLGLRVYPEYKKSSRLLPYHGIAHFSRKSDQSPIRMTVIPEMDAVSLQDVVRISDSNGITQAYISNYTNEYKIYQELLAQ